MRNRYQPSYVRVALTLTLASCGFFSVGGIQLVRATKAMVREVNAEPIGRSFGRIPLSFEENRGQSDPCVRFLSHGPGYTLSLTSREVVLALNGISPSLTREFIASRDQSKSKASTTNRTQPRDSHGRALSQWC